VPVAIYRVTIEVYSDFFPGRKVIRAVPELFVMVDSVDHADITAQGIAKARFGGCEYEFIRIDRLDFKGAVGSFTTVWQRR
jgi:hypothetical protein